MSKGITLPAGIHSPMSARRPKSISGIVGFSAAREQIRQKLRLRPRRRHIPVIVQPDSAKHKAPLTSYMIDPAYRKHADPLPPKHHQARDYKVVHFSQLPTLMDDGPKTWYRDNASEWWDSVKWDALTITGNIKAYSARGVSVLRRVWARVSETLVMFTAVARYGFLKSRKRLTGTHYRVNVPRHRGLWARLSKTWIVAGGTLAGMVVAFLVLLNPGGDLPPYPAPKESSDAGGGFTQAVDTGTATRTPPSASQQPVRTQSMSGGAPKEALSAPTPQPVKPKREDPAVGTQPAPAPIPTLPVGGYGGDSRPTSPTPSLPYTPPKELGNLPLVPRVVPEVKDAPVLLESTVDSATSIL